MVPALPQIAALVDVVSHRWLHTNEDHVDVSLHVHAHLVPFTTVMLPLLMNNESQFLMLVIMFLSCTLCNLNTNWLEYYQGQHMGQRRII